ncbi:MAG TPA: hypothetical protein DCL54_19420, partial [Alphaproteobacteria bacterium]|nr:hypothetical protein [Alphaproteobacteria bacterium]
PLPPGPVYDLVASRMHVTSERTIFTPDFTGVARVVNVQGDEAVAFQSASNGMPMSAAVVQRSHPTIFDDQFAQYTMARSFDLDAPALFRRFGGAGARLLTFDPQSDPAEVCPTLSTEQLDPSREGGVQAVLTGEDQSKVCIWRFGMTISAHDPAAPSDGMRVDAKSALAGSEIEVKIDLGGYAADFM